MSIEVNLASFELTVTQVFGGGAYVDSAASDPAPYPAEVGSFEVAVA